jgi:translation initiation factor IF-2
VKNLKLKIKNAQLAEALNIDSLVKKKQKPKKEDKKEPSKQEESTPKRPKARIVKPPREVSHPEAEESKLPQDEQPIAEQEKTQPVEEVEKSPEEEAIAEKVVQPKEPKAVPAVEEKKPPKKPAKEIRAGRKRDVTRTFDARDRSGLRAGEEERWRKKRPSKGHKKIVPQEEILRPKELKIRLPISIKELAQEMKLKASQLISKLFMQGITVTLNDYLEDETTVQLLGHEFGCELTIDTSEEERVRITDKTIQQEIAQVDDSELQTRAPVIAFMGHVDHGKTSLIDAIRKSQIAEQETGAITQHIGAFKTKTDSGEITILDTPGHEAFTQMRERGANVTDIAILVVAGDEGMREQTIEALEQSREAGVPIIVAINKCDKSGFDPQKVYRQLADLELVPESWGGSTITVNCSAVTKEGIKELLEMILLQSEVLELRASPSMRARGTVLESEMHKGLGAVATVLVQNGTLSKGDAIVVGHHWGRIKTMHDEHNQVLDKALPSTPVKITGLSDVVEAGAEFIVVKNDKEAKELAHARFEEFKHRMQVAKKAIDKLILESKKNIKLLPLLIRADVQGSLEALKTSLNKLPKKKVKIEIISEGIGEISESDVELAAASKAVILGFHTKVESKADQMAKQKGIVIKLHDIIYHAVDNIKEIMTDLLDKIEEEKQHGEAEVKAIFKASQLGVIAGCQVSNGTISRNHWVKVYRSGEMVWKGKIASLKRVKEDVKEVQKGMECGILLDGFNQVEVGDIIQSFETVYLKQELESNTPS